MGRGGLECGQIRFVPQKVSTSLRFLVVASVTCHLMPNATMSTWEVPVACFPSAPVRTQRSTRSPVLGTPSVPCCGLMNTIYSAPNHLHERHRSPYSRYYVGLRFGLRPGAGEALSSVSHHTYLPGTRHKTGSTAHGRIQIQAQFEAKAIFRPIRSWSVGGAKNVLQQLTWEWGLGEAERAERVGETTQYCTEHGVGGVLITNRTYAPPGMAAGLSLSYC